MKQKHTEQEMNKGPWTHFMDMHSGGQCKEKWQHIFIQAPEEEAITIFYNRFGHNPHRVTCTCCGEDYSITESKNLQQATAYNRECNYDQKTGKYTEADNQTYVKYGGKVRTYMPFTEFLKTGRLRPDKGDEEREVAKIIFKWEIKPEERAGDVPEQGYVWQD